MKRALLHLLKKCPFTTFIVFFFCILYCLPAIPVYAGDYGRGDFGKENYGQGQSSSSTGSSSSDSTTSSSSNTNNTSPSGCTSQVPGAKAPWIYGATAINGSSVLLYFTEADNPVDRYILQYGIRSGEYIYGVQDLGLNERHQMTSLIHSLAPNTTYYFQIRAGNGCATGPWSNEVSVRTKNLIAFNQLNLSSERLIPKSHTVTPVEGSDPLEVNEDRSVEKEEDSEGYDVYVTVIDTESMPIEGATVTLHSTPRSTTTNKEGIASFSNVESGNHRLLIAYEGYEGEQAIVLNGDEKEFRLKVTIEKRMVVFSKISLVIIGLLIVIVGALSIGIFKVRRNR